MSADRDQPDRKPPLVSVAMPVYNAGKYLRLAVLSIVRQTFTDWELLIIDDGSTDNALNDISDIRDERIRIFRDGLNKGLAARLNECIDMARGQYLARMDQDDVSFPERFMRQLKVLQQDSDIDLVAVRSITISSENQYTGMVPGEITHEELVAKPWRGIYLPHPSWMGKTSWFRHYRYMIPGPYFCEDQELLLRSHENSRFAVVAEPLFAYRLRNAINWSKQIKTRQSVLKVQLRYFLSQGQLYFALLSLATYAGRLLSDLLRFASGKSITYRGAGNAEIEQKWQQVLSIFNIGTSTDGH